MGLEKKLVRMKIVDKSHKKEGLLRRDAYRLIFRVEDTKNNKLIERKVPLSQYLEYKTGETVEATLYSKNGKDWYFSPEEI